MFVLVRNDLSKSQQGVQGGHALAQFALEHPERFREWSNHIIVYLKVDYEWLLEHRPESESSAFYEPDIGNELTAKATYCLGTDYKDLRLM
jgi:hypothetical protein